MARRLGWKIWQGHLDAWERSGLTQVEYCASQGLSIKTFTRWRCRSLAAKASPAKPATVTLIPVSVAQPANPMVVQLHSPGGWRVELPGSSMAWLNELLRQLP